MTKRERVSSSFLVIGAQRAGTSWLWRQLRAHPDIWMPQVKELHYFDRSPSYPSPSYLATRTGIGGMFRKGEDAAVFRRRFLRRLATDLPRWELVRWDLEYFLGPRNDEWYLSLFARGDGRVCGEATPAYAILRAPDVERIATLLPEVRVVFVLRNPVERAWSHLRQYHGAGIRAGSMSIDEMHDFVDSPAQELRSDYARTIRIWSQHVPGKRLRIAFYDHLVADPKRFLESVCGSLGVAPARIDPATCCLGPVGAAPAFPMPPALRRHLARKYLEPMARLSDEYGDPPLQWLRDAKATLRRDN